MRKITIIVLALALVLLASCESFRADYYVDGTYYASQDESHFGEPWTPSLPQDRIFSGWGLEGGSEPYTDWTQLPDGEVRFDAIITDIDYIEFYVGDSLYERQLVTQFAEPEAPEAPAGKSFAGWALPDSSELVEDWSAAPEDALRLNAVFMDNYDFYVNGKLWKSVAPWDYADPGIPEESLYPVEKSFDGWTVEGSSTPVTDWTAVPEEEHRLNAVLVDDYLFYVNGELWKDVSPWNFGDPGTPEDKLIPRGYVFEGWLSAPDYTPYSDWKAVPGNGVLRFDALLSENTVASAIGDNNVKLSYSPHREIEVLGPVFIEEPYEIVRGGVKVGGIGYSDIMKAALELYPGADQVIDIVVDYSTMHYTLQSDGSGQVERALAEDYAEASSDSYFRVATYTGIAIDIL